MSDRLVLFLLFNIVSLAACCAAVGAAFFLGVLVRRHSLMLLALSAQTPSYRALVVSLLDGSVLLVASVQHVLASTVVKRGTEQMVHVSKKEREGGRT
eukprot:scaffold17366_cov182-Amphora_coffeaeformis.AAC.3